MRLESSTANSDPILFLGTSVMYTHREMWLAMVIITRGRCEKSAGSIGRTNYELSKTWSMGGRVTCSLGEGTLPTLLTYLTVFMTILMC